LFLSLTLDDKQHDFSGLDPTEKSNPDQGVHFSQVDLQGNVALNSPTAGSLPNETILTLHDFSGAKFTDIVQPSLHGDADLAAKITVDFSALAAQINDPALANILPKVNADLVAHWDLSVDTTGAHFGDPFLAFENISLDVGSFIPNFVGPILDQIHQILSPLDWLIGSNGLLNLRLPLLSDLAGKTITIVDMIPIFDPTDGP